MEVQLQGKHKAKGEKMEQEVSTQKTNSVKKAQEAMKPSAVKGNGDATEQNTSNNDRTRSSKSGQNKSANIKSSVRQKRKIVPSKTDKTPDEDQPKKRVKQPAQNQKKQKINVPTVTTAKPGGVAEKQEEKERNETTEEQMDGIEWTVVDESKCDNEQEVEEATRATVSMDEPKFENMDILKSPLIQAKMAAEEEIRKIMGLDESKPVIFSAESLQSIKLDSNRSESDYKPNVFTVDWKDIEAQLTSPPLSQRCQPSTAMTGPPETYVTSPAKPEPPSTVDQNVVHFFHARQLKECKVCMWVNNNDIHVNLFKS